MPRESVKSIDHGAFFACFTAFTTELTKPTFSVVKLLPFFFLHPDFYHGIDSIVSFRGKIPTRFLSIVRFLPRNSRFCRSPW